MCRRCRFWAGADVVENDFGAINAHDGFSQSERNTYDIKLKQSYENIHKFYTHEVCNNGNGNVYGNKKYEST